MSSLFTNRSPLPGRPGCRATGPSSPASFTYFEASLPLRVRSLQQQVSPLPQAAALLGLCPSRAFSKTSLGVCHPQEPKFKHARLPVGSGTLPTGPESPRPGKVSPITTKVRFNLLDGFQPPSGLARTASRRRSSPHDLGATTATAAPGLQGLLVTRLAAFPPRRRLLFWGFLPLQQPRDYGSSPVLAYRFTGSLGSRLRPPAHPSDL